MTYPSEEIQLAEMLLLVHQYSIEQDISVVLNQRNIHRVSNDHHFFFGQSCIHEAHLYILSICSIIAE